MPHILHFGLGNFHRAHQAWYTERANRAGGETWRITGVSLRAASVRDLLQPQDCDYTLVISGAGEPRFEPIKVIDRVLVAGPDTDAILASIADPDTAIISLTVTEKGYYLRADSGQLDPSDPAIQADLTGTAQTIYGLLLRGLQMRHAANAAPLTILSCDNLSANGDTLAAALRSFTAQVDPSLITYLNDHVTFPNCMVDRITPATTQSTLDQVKANTGWADRAPVATESFSEWIIEDRFAAARPAWDTVGAQLVSDVIPFELRKLRLLNGAHSYLAYAGTLCGHTYVHEAIADPTLRAGVAAIMSEAAETLPDGIRDSTADYAAALITRFENPDLHHKLRQIAMDGTLKLPIRLVATWKDRHARGLGSPAIATAIASWMGFARVETKAGRALQDPAATEVATICTAATPEALSTGLCTLIGAPKDLATLPIVLKVIRNTWGERR